MSVIKNGKTYLSSSITNLHSFIEFADKVIEAFALCDISLNKGYIAIQVKEDIFDKIAMQAWNRNLTYNKDYKSFNVLNIEYNGVKFKLYIYER